ncbi:hypothetical protein B0H14DRAFT_2574659 [Mycena olivaceomarginata]|nr:hypothetical protein B0H14DRAFT_2574659 [Mycena olivaceomarginata]
MPEPSVDPAPDAINLQVPADSQMASLNSVQLGGNLKSTQRTRFTGSLVLHESHPAAPGGFVSHGSTPADEVFTLRITLTSNNITSLESKLVSLSTPGSAEYGQWLLADEVSSFVVPAADTVSTFSAWDLPTNSLTPTDISLSSNWQLITLHT